MCGLVRGGLSGLAVCQAKAVSRFHREGLTRATVALLQTGCMGLRCHDGLTMVAAILVWLISLVPVRLAPFVRTAAMGSAGGMDATRLIQRAAVIAS